MHGRTRGGATLMLAAMAMVMVAACGNDGSATPAEAGTPAPGSTAAPASDAPRINGDALPLWTGGDDPAVGMPAPTVDGFDYAGNRATIQGGSGATLVVFAAHWCPHCNVELGLMLGWMADGTIPTSLPVTLVSTAEAAGTPNYPADQWLANAGWTAPVLRDSHAVDGEAGDVAKAFGASAWPFSVLIGADGRVLARTAGQLDVNSLTALLTPTSRQALGSLQMPTVGVELSVVDGRGYPEAAALTVGPMLSRGPSPADATDTANPAVVVATRAAFGNIDVSVAVQAGDQFTWTDSAGSRRFEVVWTEVCTGADCGTTESYTLVIELADGPDRVFAKPVA
ncbi:MAG: TlpA family protein disulfide reductase [Ilumatobacteraceae bacterium]